ncbi:hypothetical protein XspCFBP7912_09910 [Xanthomonas sp. CFBP 7912]|nr:hypothetical protein XspCFBP7912_09910 [Xanthomonas sp. CFBP 7912]RJS02535.1 hypothetical protein XnspCFBP7698_16550 [Xanthomonas sp. CFBP 7698]
MVEAQDREVMSLMAAMQMSTRRRAGLRTSCNVPRAVPCRCMAAAKTMGSVSRWVMALQPVHSEHMAALAKPSTLPAR